VTVSSVSCRISGDAQTTGCGAGINVRLNEKKSLYVDGDISTSPIHSGGDTTSVSYDITGAFP